MSGPRALPVAIIGPGNIGTDLLFKAQRSPHLDPVWSVGVVETSEGLQIARSRGVKTSHLGLEAVIDQLCNDGVKIAFDATSAKYHAHHNDLLQARGIRVIDLTPASLGPYCVPSVNLDAVVGEMNVNMVSCGAQATIPMVAAVSRVQAVSYGEIVATVASKSIGPGTRSNIDEFTRTTRAGVEVVGNVPTGKAIIIINPAEPPMIMRDTVHCFTKEAPDQEAITASVHAMVEEVQKYVPGYTLKNGPVFDGKRMTVWLEVKGLGDYLPTYAGNLDIMTAAAVRTAELMAEAMA